MASVTSTLLLGACGARTSLDVPDASGSGSQFERPAAGAGGNAAQTVGIGSGTTTVAVGSGGGSAEPTCSLGDMSTWRTERFVDGGDYERTAVALSGEPWVALKRRDGNIILANIGIDGDRGIVFRETIEIPNSPVYPVGLDMDERRFVLLTTTGINWNGDVELWRIDRESGTVVRTPVGNPPKDPAYTVYSALGLAGDQVVLAYDRANEQAAIEIRDDDLHVVQSLSVDASSFQAVRPSAGALDVYLGATSKIHFANGTYETEQIDPTWQVFGGLGDFRVEIGQAIRLVRGAETWTGDWPHSQISPPAVVRTNGSRVAFSLETELTAVVGYPSGSAIEWLRIESTAEASGLGLGLLPVVDDGRLGLLYLGLEIPDPEQPLRYYGLACP